MQDVNPATAHLFIIKPFTAAGLSRLFSTHPSTEDRIAKNTEFTKKMIDKGLTHGREVAALAAKAGSEATEVLQRRTTEGLDEMRAIASKAAA